MKPFERTARMVLDELSCRVLTTRSPSFADIERVRRALESAYRKGLKERGRPVVDTEITR